MLPPAFSLAELMIALGILAIGIAMVAALFPAALKQTELSYNDTIGTIIAQNGLAVARATLTKDDIPTGPNLAVVADDPNGTLTGKAKLTKNMRAYQDISPADKGFLVLGSKPTADSNSCLLVIVAYAKKNPSANVRAEQVSLTSAITGTKASINTIPGGLKGSPLILEASGAYAIIEKVDGMNLDLDHDKLNGLVGTGWVIVEDGSSGLSPAIAVLVARVALP